MTEETTTPTTTPMRERRRSLTSEDTQGRLPCPAPSPSARCRRFCGCSRHYWIGPKKTSLDAAAAASLWSENGAAEYIRWLLEGSPPKIAQRLNETVTSFCVTENNPYFLMERFIKSKSNLQQTESDKFSTVSVCRNNYESTQVSNCR